jgi:hypothetical protein
LYRSMSTTLKPRRHRRIASVEPAGPAPAIMIGKSRFGISIINMVAF